GVDPTLVHRTSVWTLWFFTTVGRTATSRAGRPPWSEKVGSGVSATPPRTRAAGPATRQAVASRQNARRNVMEEPAPGAPASQGMRTSGMVTMVGGGRLQGAAGSQIVCSLSTSIAVQKTFSDVATTRPEPLRRLGSPLPAVFMASVWSSCSTAVPAVAMVTVRPAATASIAPLPSTQHAGQSAPGQPLTVSVLLSTVHACPARLPALHRGPAAATLLRNAPVSSKTWIPMSTGAASRLVHTKSVSRLLFLIRPNAV